MANNHPHAEKGLLKIVLGASLGTLIEWYDFYIFGSLALIISVHFFPANNPTAALLSTLATFAAGFVVRPFGAVFFGQLGDLIGRRYTFIITLSIMGLSTFIIGIVPGYETIGFLSPLLVLVLRLLQGLALGGEYGGAASYVGEHAPHEERGYYTSWIQTTATIGLLVSLGVILITRTTMGEVEFKAWGWRIPFLVSIVLFLISLYIRVKMKESPMFAKLKSEGGHSVNPLKESFGHRLNLKYVLLALLGATMGQGVVWYTGQFYALSFIQTQGVDFTQSNYIVLTALLLATPGFILFGWLSDRMTQRKWIMLLGMILAVFTYRPIYSSMLAHINPDNGELRQLVADQSTSVTTEAMDGDMKMSVVTEKRVFNDGTVQDRITKTQVLDPVADAGKTAKVVATNSIKLGDSAFWWLMFLVWIQVVYVTMVYGPIAAFLFELFPTKIRYTSMSLPYHIGNGVFGGLVPFIATALVLTAKANKSPDASLAGLWYPISIALVSAVIGFLYINHRSYARAHRPDPKA